MWIKILRDKNSKILPESLPKVAGKYLVKTETLMGNTHRVDTKFTGNHFVLSNQIPIEWLDESKFNISKTYSNGFLIKLDGVWHVNWAALKYFNDGEPWHYTPLCLEDAIEFKKDEMMFDNLESRATGQPVEFEIIYGDNFEFHRAKLLKK